MNYYDELPEGYVEDKAIDAKDKVTIILLNIVGLALMAVVLILSMWAKGFFKTGLNLKLGDVKSLIVCLVFLVSIILYVILHELVHGLFYKIFTHKKLTFGFSLSVAYCGIPSIYTKKPPMLVTVLAPFVVFTVPCLIALPLINDTLIFLAVAIFLGLHVAGCVGDLYVALVLIFKYKDVLINDTGAKQTFYIKK